MTLVSASAMQLAVWVVLAALLLTFGFMAGVRFANNEHRRNGQIHPPALPTTDSHRDYYAAHRPAAVAPVALTVNVHTTPAPSAPQREYVLNGETVPALTERADR